MRTKRLLILGGLWLALSGPVGAQTAPAVSPAAGTPPAAASADARMQWWREARYGLFLHWGFYAVPAGQWGRKTQLEPAWFQLQTRMRGVDYAKYAAQFNPTNFNARQWVQIARDAGMKYVVITAKHHDGFCLYETGATEFNIVRATPFGRDALKELAAACREGGLKLGFFYSLPDWHHPEMPAALNQRGFHGAPRKEADFGKYLAFLREQVTNGVEELFHKVA